MPCRAFQEPTLCAFRTSPAKLNMKINCLRLLSKNMQWWAKCRARSMKFWIWGLLWTTFSLIMTVAWFKGLKLSLSGSRMASTTCLTPMIAIRKEKVRRTTNSSAISNDLDALSAQLKKAIIGSQEVNLQTPGGVACVVWCQKLKDLVSLYVNNTEKAQRDQRFYISKVIIKDYVDISDDWYNFKGKFFGF